MPGNTTVWNPCTVWNPWTAVTVKLLCDKQSEIGNQVLTGDNYAVNLFPRRGTGRFASYRASGVASAYTRN